MRQRQHQRGDRAVGCIVAHPVRPCQHQRAGLRPVTRRQHPPRLARLAGEDGIAVERDGDDIGIGRARRMGLKRGERAIEPPLLFADMRGAEPALQLRPRLETGTPLGAAFSAGKIGERRGMRRGLVGIGGGGLRQRR